MGDLFRINLLIGYPLNVGLFKVLLVNKQDFPCLSLYNNSYEKCDMKYDMVV